MAETSPFHEGERAIQERLGVRETIEPWARKVVRSYLPQEHRDFYAQLPFVVLAARDALERPWATIVASEPGFCDSPDPTQLLLGAELARGDGLENALTPGADVGILGIELETRRRNRVNGRVVSRDARGISLGVEQSFGNCPQHITLRQWQPSPPDDPQEAPFVERARTLLPGMRRMIERADTLFIATGFRGEGEQASYGMDASHRGGAPGFVRITGERGFAFEDLPGNNHFNTIGNLALDSRVGFAFVDFERGTLLQLTGSAHVEWRGEARELHFELDEARLLHSALPLRWAVPLDASFPVRVRKRTRESADVVSFELETAVAGQALPRFRAGQHLPIEATTAAASAGSGTTKPATITRTYSLSGNPSDPHYRISVKRETHGAASRWLHDTVRVGDIIRAAKPAGAFVLDPAESRRDVMLVSAGIGVTPMLAMLHARVAHGAAGAARKLWFVHGARDGNHHALAAEARALAGSASGVDLHVRYSQPSASDRAAPSYHSVGRVDAALLEQLCPGLDVDIYLCGPTAFMDDVFAGLAARGVPEERIHTESFGGGA